MHDQTRLIVSSLLNIKIKTLYCYRQQKSLLGQAQQKAKRKGAGKTRMPAVVNTYKPQASETRISKPGTQEVFFRTLSVPYSWWIHNLLEG
jgi:hypothetical protein